MSDRLTAEKIERMVADNHAGVSARTLSSVYAIGTGTVLQLLGQHGVEIRGQPVTAADQQRIIALYARCWSLAKVAKALGRNATTIGERSGAGWDITPVAALSLRGVLTAAARPVIVPCKLSLAPSWRTSGAGGMSVGRDRPPDAIPSPLFFACRHQTPS